MGILELGLWRSRRQTYRRIHSAGGVICLNVSEQFTAWIVRDEASVHPHLIHRGKIGGSGTEERHSGGRTTDYLEHLAAIQAVVFLGLENAVILGSPNPEMGESW